IGQSGLLRHFQIYNSKGVLICTATESKYLSHEWRLLTYKDNRFHSLNVPTEDDLMQILKSLISKDYL
ncbi:MAG: hypothetical protein IT245_05070, partial [Bacteroidia bacterium]|nr:hypothetical protein [Bacteroidia bacterium]